MTELTKRFIDTTKKITTDDIKGAMELSALIMVFAFCLFTLSPIF